jgi:signal transduction histidine kinase
MTDEEVTVSDRDDRSATPLIDVRTCQRQAREPFDGQITITVSRDVHEVHVAIHDDGIGIPTPAFPHVFEPFYRVGNGGQQLDARHIPGFGIGLFAA